MLSLTTEVGGVENLPLAVLGRLVDLARESTNTALLVLAPSPTPSVVFAHQGCLPRFDASDLSINSLQSLTSLSDAQLEAILSPDDPASENAASSSHIQTISHYLKVERLHAGASRFVILAIGEADYNDQQRLSPRLYSLVTANWVSSLVHAICQPTHVMQNVAELIEIQHNAGEIVGDPLPRYIEMLRMATRQANDQLGAVKLQFREFADTPERIDLVPRLRDFAQAVDGSFVSTHSSGYVNCDRERLEMLLECIAALARTDVPDSAGGAAEPSVSMQANGSDLEITVDFGCTVRSAKDVLEARGNDILPTAICRVCVNLVEGFFGKINFLNAPPTTHNTTSEVAKECADSVSLVKGIAITIPGETVNVENRLPRAVRRIW